MARSLFLMVVIAFAITLSNAATHNYMDNSAMCSGSTVQIWSDSETNYVSAWNPTSIFHTPITGGCTMTFSAFGAYGTKYKFSSGGYITSSGVTLNIYSGASTYGTLLGSYTWHSSLPTSYTYTHNGYITVELVNPSNAKLFDFTIQVKNYDDIDYFTAGDISGVVIGCIAFVIVVSSVSVYVRIRRRRFLLANAGIATASVASVTTSSHHHHHHHSGHH